jgi:hypothetical protein
MRARPKGRKRHQGKYGSCCSAEKRGHTQRASLMEGGHITCVFPISAERRVRDNVESRLRFHELFHHCLFLGGRGHLGASELAFLACPPAR